jgi:hypothetical protein
MREIIDGASQNNLRILLRFAMPRTVLFEVAKQGCRVVAEIAEVHSFATFSEKQKSVENLEQLSGRLMYCAKDSLAVVGKIP